MAPVRFPLPKDALPDIAVTDKQAQVYLTHVYNLVDEALREYERYEALGTNLYKQPWKTTAKSANARVVRMKDAVMPARTHYRVMGRLEADDRQLMEFMYAETTEQFREWQQIVFPTVVDAKVLAPLMTATTEHPHQCMGIRWVASQPTPWVRLYTTFIEFLSYVQDARGRTLGVRVAVPVDVPQIASQMERYKMRRYDHTIVQVLAPSSRPNHQLVNTFTIVQYDHSPAFAPSDFDKYLLNVIENAPTSAMIRRIARSRLLPPSEWVPNGLRRNCVVCKRGFTTTRGRHHCRMCGDVICRNCVIHQNAPQYTSESSFRLIKTKFCVFCMTMLRESPPDMPGRAIGKRANSLDNSQVFSAGSGVSARSDPKRDPPPNVPVRPRRTSSLSAAYRPRRVESTPSVMKSSERTERSDRLAADAFLNESQLRLNGKRLELVELGVLERSRCNAGPTPTTAPTTTAAPNVPSSDLLALLEIEQRIAKKDRLLSQLDCELEHVDHDFHLTT